MGTEGSNAPAQVPGGTTSLEWPDSWHRAGTGAGGATGMGGATGLTPREMQNAQQTEVQGGKHQMGTIELIKEKHKGREGTCSINILQGNQRTACTEALGLHRSMTKNHCDIARKTNSILRISPCKKHSLPREGNMLLVMSLHSPVSNCMTFFTQQPQNHNSRWCFTKV